MTYRIYDASGNRSGPIDPPVMYDFIRQGKVMPHTVIEGANGTRINAASHPILLPLFREMGAINDVMPGETHEWKPLPSENRPGFPGETGVQGTDHSSAFRGAGNYGIPQINATTGSGKKGRDAGIVMAVLGGIGLFVLLVALPTVYTINALVASVFLSVFCGVFANARGLEFVWGFGLSLALSPIIGFIGVAVQPKNDALLAERELQRGHAKRCIFCAELINPQAVICRYCRGEQPPIGKVPFPSIPPA